MIFVVLSHVMNLCIIGQAFSLTIGTNNVVLNPLNLSQTSSNGISLTNGTHSNSAISKPQYSFLSQDQDELSNAQESSNNRYKSNDGLNQKAITLISNHFSNPTFNHISSITSSLDNDLYHMSFTQDELMETKFPHNMSQDIDMDPCKSGKLLLWM